MEKIPMEQGPNIEIFESVMTEAMDKFEGHMMTPELIVNLEFFLNQRLQQEIDRGNFRNRFITPNNRIAEFAYVEIKQDRTDPRRILASPRWVYIDED